MSSLTELSLGRNPFCDSKPLSSNVKKSSSYVKKSDYVWPVEKVVTMGQVDLVAVAVVLVEFSYLTV